MSININVVSHMSNKSYEIIDTQGNLITENVSNTLINIPYNTSYVLYVKPDTPGLGYTGLLDLSNSFLSGIYGYLFIFIIGILFYFMLKLVKQYV